MARQIKSTPILSGEDARRFERATKDNTNRQIPAEEYRRAQEAVKLIRFVKK